MNPHARSVDFPRKDDGMGFAWRWEGQRFTPAYEARVAKLFAAISLFPDWTPAIEFAGSEDGEVVVAYYRDADYWRYVFAVEDPAEQEWIDELIKADASEGVACETPATEDTVFVAGLACAPNGLMAYLRDFFAQASSVAETDLQGFSAALESK